MHDWRDGQTRYLIHFQGAGSGMRHRDEPLGLGDVVTNCGENYRIARVEQPKNERAFGHARAELI